MREGVKKKIRVELKLVLDELALKRNEITDAKTDEEGMPDTQKEATVEYISGERNHSASETTNNRLSTLIALENTFSTKDATFQKSMLDPETDEMTLLNEVEEYCKEIKKKIKNI